jgi:ribonucleoside-diphosphate reductase alpha chain
MNAVSAGQESGGAVAMSAMDAAAAAAKLQMASGPATDIKFCGVDDPTCESCQ